MSEVEDLITSGQSSFAALGLGGNGWLRILNFGMGISKRPFDFSLYLACTIFSRDGFESLVSMRDAFKPVMTDTRLSVRGVFNPKFA